MKLKNSEVLSINQGLDALMDTPMSGRLKFRIARNKRAVEEVVIDILKVTDNLESDDRQEVLDEPVELELQTFTEEELSHLEITPLCIMRLEKIIKEEGTGYE